LRRWLWVAAALPIAVAGAIAEQLPRFSIAVVRADGILIPFTHFDGRRWRNDWPLPEVSPKVPLGLHDVPSKWWPNDQPELSWTLWTDDGEGHTLTVRAPAWTRAQCQARVGLRTDLQMAGPLPPPDTQPYPKAGAATTAGVRLEPIAVLDDTTKEWRALAEELRAPFTRAEARALSDGWRLRSEHPVRAEERREWPIKIEALYRAPHTRPGSQLYYFEAMRSYPWKTDETGFACDLVTFAWGWLLETDEGGRDLQVFARIADCNRWGISFMMPLGVLRADGRPLWVVQYSGWEAEDYGIIDFRSPFDPYFLVAMPAGRC